ncbi:MAG: cytochrome-c peroxidase, partial [Candidatus Methylomirabilales bacterium]
MKAFIRGAVLLAFGALWMGFLWVDVLWGEPLDIGPLPPVPVPPDNPMSPEKIELGRLLFFDFRLSGDGSRSCVHCHQPDQGWSFRDRQSPAYPTQIERRASMTLINVAYNKALIWDGRTGTLEKQALGPIQNPLHMNQNLDLLIERLRSIPEYVKRFQQVFGTDVTPDGVGKALAAFERTLVTKDSPFDRYMKGDKTALSPSAAQGLDLFKGKARCILCHNGPNFTDHSFHNLGLPEAPFLQDPRVQASIRFDAKRMGIKDYRRVTTDLGRYLVTKDEKDIGAFKTPTLRNVVERGPYMHNGAFDTLEQVIDFYNQGGGDDPRKDPMLRPLDLTPQEKADLLA